MGYRLLLLTVLCFSSWGSAFADIAPPRPEDMDCPRGAKGAVNTAGVAWCEPTVCANDVTCGEGYQCSNEDIGLCVEEIRVPTERVRPMPGEPMPDVPMQTTRSVRRRGCEPNGTCLNADSTCEQARRCVKVEAPVDVPSAVLATPPPDEPRSGCACGATGGGAALGWGALAVFVLVKRG